MLLCDCITMVSQTICTVKVDSSVKTHAGMEYSDKVAESVPTAEFKYRWSQLTKNEKDGGCTFYQNAMRSEIV